MSVSDPTDAREWEHAAAAVLRKARRLAVDDPDERVRATLTRTTVEGIAVPPLSGPAQVADLPPTGQPGTAPFTRGASSAISPMGWDIRALMTDPEPALASTAAVADLENGATSLWWTVGGSGTAPDQLIDALDGVYLDLAPVVLQAAGAVSEIEAADALAEVVRRTGVVPAAGTSFGADPISRSLRTGSPVGDRLASIPELITRAADLGVDAMVVDATAAHAAGAGDAGELGYSLAVAVAYLRSVEGAGLDVDSFARTLEFRYAATDEQFVAIAKFRAARALWNRVCEIVGVRSALGQRQHAVTSRSMMTRYDPWNNLLRTTIAAFAAGVGGAQAITVLPFDSPLGVPDAMGRRMARNISSLLIAESHVAAVVDPAGGSAAVEILTAELADAGWAEFGRIEAAGGILAALDDGSLRQRISDTRAERNRRVDSRRAPVTGVTEFPNLTEALPSRRPWAVPDGEHSWVATFEAMRDVPTVTPVFLATLGPVAQHTVRAGFVTNVLAAGGIAVLPAGATTGVDDVVAAYRAAGPEPLPVVCLAGTDAAYGDVGNAVILGLRAAGARHVILAGKPVGALAELPVDDFVAAGADIAAFLQRTRSHLDSSHLDSSHPGSSHLDSDTATDLAEATS